MSLYLTAEDTVDKKIEAAARVQHRPEGWRPGVSDAHDVCEEHGPSCPCPNDHHFDCPWPAETPTREDGLPLWMPTRYTKSLTGDEDFPNLWDQYKLPSGDHAIQRMWRKANGYEFGEDQVWVLRHSLEVFPSNHKKAGTLRWREKLFLEGRQNGKSEQMSGECLIGLIRKVRVGEQMISGNQTVIGVARIAKQAEVIYNRVATAIKKNEKLKAKYTPSKNSTRGIQAVDGTGSYEVKASNADTLQGFPGNMVIIDEIHVLKKKETWMASVKGMGSRDDQCVSGITTAGDNLSMVLHWLKERGEAAIELEPKRNQFGYFVWEANEAAVPEFLPEDDPENDRLWADPHDNRLWAELCRANPGFAIGRRPRDNGLRDVRATEEPDIIRFDLNRDINSINSFIPLAKVLERIRGNEAEFPDERAVYSFALSENWRALTISRHVKVEETGETWSATVATIANPSPEDVLALTVGIDAAFRPLEIVMNRPLLNVAHDARDKGVEVRVMTDQDLINASSLFFAKIMSKRWIWHRTLEGDNALEFQLPWTKRANVTGGYKIVVSTRTEDIEAVLSFVAGIYVADIHREPELQFF